MHYVRSRRCVVSWSCDQFRSSAARSGACASWDWRVSRMSALTSSCLVCPARAVMPCNWSSSVKPVTRPEHLTILSLYNCVYLSCWKFAGFSTRLCTINWAPSARQFTCKGIPESSRASYMQKLLQQIAISCKYILFNCKHDKAEALFSVQKPYRAFTWLLCNLVTALKSNGSTCFSKTCCDCVCDSSSLLIALPSCKVIACFNQAHRNWLWKFVSSEHRPFLTPATAFASSESATVDPRIPSEASGPLFLEEIKSSYLRLFNKAGCLKCHELGKRDHHEDVDCRMSFQYQSNRLIVCNNRSVPWIAKASIREDDTFTRRYYMFKWHLWSAWSKRRVRHCWIVSTVYLSRTSAIFAQDWKGCYAFEYGETLCPIIWSLKHMSVQTLWGSLGIDLDLLAAIRHCRFFEARKLCWIGLSASVLTERWQ